MDAASEDAFKPWGMRYLARAGRMALELCINPTGAFFQMHVAYHCWEATTYIDLDSIPS